MSAISSDLVRRSIGELMGEVFTGPTHPYTWIVSNDADAGLFATLEGLSASDASRTLAEGGKTVASHTEHLRFSLAYVNAHFRAENPSPDFTKSWSVSTVSEAQWKALQAALRQEFEAVTDAVAKQDDWSDPMMLIGTIAMVAHAAYHLGAIRQMYALLRTRRDPPTAAD
jgi:hypothetical protein